MRAEDLADFADVIVVGGGSAGCAMAARLAEAGRHVLLVEAGKSDVDLRCLVPALTVAVVNNPEYDRGVVCEPDETLGGRADRGGRRPVAGAERQRVAVLSALRDSGGLALWPEPRRARLQRLLWPRVSDTVLLLRSHCPGTEHVVAVNRGTGFGIWTHGCT